MSNSAQNSSVVYIYAKEKNEKTGKDEKVQRGMGVLIDNSHIITCAHIFDDNEDNMNFSENESNQQNESNRDFCLVFSSKPDSEPIHFEIIKYDKKVDFAVLKIEERPSYSNPIRSLSIKNTPHQNHNVQIFGVTEGYEEGVCTFYKIQVTLPNDHIQIAKRKEEPSIEITSGFSGACVWDDNLEGAIGIINVAADDVGLAQVIPFDLIKEKYSELTLIEPDSSLYNKIPDVYKLLLKYLDDRTGVSLGNIIEMRNNLKKLDNCLNDRDLEKINKISGIVIHEWSTVRDKFFIQEENVYKYIFNFAEYDDIHCILLEEKLYETIFGKSIDELINARNLIRKIQKKDLLLLIAACWLHDIGMVPELFKDDEILKGKKDDYFIKDVFTSIFKNHPKRATRFIEERKKELSIDDLEDLKKLCEFHRHKEYVPIINECKKFENGKANTPTNIALLACYLRLAGAIQVPRRSEVKGFVPMGFEDPYSMFQWLKSQCVEKTEIKSSEHKIQIYIKVPNELVESPNVKVLKDSLQMEIQNELDFTRDIFIKYNKNFYLIADCGAKPMTFDQEEKKEFSELLSNIELFVPMMSPNASAVMKIVLDQIRAILLSTEDSIRNINALKNYNLNILGNIVRKRPCHVFFAKVNKFLDVQLKKIESKESSEEFKKTEEDLRRKTYDDTQKRILRKIEAWIERRKNIIETGLPDVACSILLDSSPTLLFGFSSSVVNSFEYAIKVKKIERVKSTEIYVCEAASKREYRYNNRLVYCDGIKYIEKLNELGMKNIYYITDACASNLFSKGKISKVLFGANGIDCEGNVHHTLGHLAIADMASKYNINVYVLSDSLKIGIIHADLETQRGNQWLTTDVEQEFKLKGDNIHYYNPRGDMVPSNLITSIITENGISSPDRVKELTDVYWIQEGKRLLKEELFEEALKCFERAIELYPDDECVHYFKSKALIGLKRKKEAEEIREKGNDCWRM